MLLKTDINIPIDNIKINFDTEGLWVLNIALAVIMFGVALSIKITDFKRLLQKPKLLLVGVFSQFFLLPSGQYCRAENNRFLGRGEENRRAELRGWESSASFKLSFGSVLQGRNEQIPWEGNRK